MSTPEKLLVVVDPSQDDHIALQRALITSRIRKPCPELHVFVAIDPESVDTRACNDKLFRQEDWFDRSVRTPLEEAGIKYELEISWSTEWQKSILNQARRISADNIFIPVKGKSEKHRFSLPESVWSLLKSAPCPVVMERPGGKEKRETVLAAVNFQATSDVQRELNNKILEQGKRWADGYNARFCVANIYLDSMNYPDRGKLANQTGLPPEDIFVRQGYTDEQVSALAEEIDADLVIMGTLGANGMLKSYRGYTAERLIAALDVDVMVINHE
ncbi:universal stress protein [Teredinibacter sp. KSP-S5-2]|uniref:universal stress protein n=1 Tax=Teredinibacter sp. KSP-S5-2 TaxID=3034506 RepID=UPI00293425A4|nr:universal stress protein [Teredinibacter sp. KSP-S5-2]WNO10833.1 universal stress protein [Teredinibacter sp. KSP-S5-2]